MRDFFKPWRRKVGVVTLGLACVFMVGWVRSIVVCDYISIPTREESSGGKPPTGWYLASSNGYFLVYSGPADMESNWPLPNYYNHDDETFSPNDLQKIQFHCLGFWTGETEVVAGTGPNPNEVLFRLQMFFVSYWLIVLPVTLVSACLLLSKPRPAVPKPTTVPAATTGT